MIKLFQDQDDDSNSCRFLNKVMLACQQKKLKSDKMTQMVNEVTMTLQSKTGQINNQDKIVLESQPQKPSVRSRGNGPLYRGVSKNGQTGWQIMCMFDGQQNFVGTFDNVNMAAIIYDIVQIQQNGLEVKTNLSYRKVDLIAILSID